MPATIAHSDTPKPRGLSRVQVATMQKTAEFYASPNVIDESQRTKRTPDSVQRIHERACEIVEAIDSWADRGGLSHCEAILARAMADVISVDNGGELDFDPSDIQELIARLRVVAKTFELTHNWQRSRNDLMLTWSRQFQSLIVELEAMTT